MRGFRIFVAASACGLAMTAAAHAADPPEKWYPKLKPFAVLTSAWYLRGDIGYRGGTIWSAESSGAFPLPTDNRLSGVAWGGLGAGFKWDAIRTDLTVDFAPAANYTGTDSANVGTTSAKIQSINTLLNFYYDIGTWNRITPYIGAGAGAAYLKVSNYQSTTVPPLTPIADHTQWNLAWAVMAGASYQFLPNLSIDAGYRYLNQGNLEIASDASGGLTLKGLAAHEFRIGLRWMYDAPAYIR
jgi:opacity protein-like surface antigen